MGLIDSVYMFKTLLVQHLQVYKRMVESKTIRPHQVELQKFLEDARRIANYKIKFEIEEIVAL